jgi:RNA polymerase sigma-70 factor (ECF subfamily)
MRTKAPTSAVTAGRFCRRGGCARLCTEQGMADAYSAYRTCMLARARRIVVDPALAEEAVQEAFARAWRACASFDPATGPLLNWLLVITANVSIDMVKARVRRPLLSALPPADAAPSGRISDIDLVVLRGQLRHALSRLRVHHRDAVVETVLRDRPYADVAAELGIPMGTLRTRVHYALRHLRSVLELAEVA